MTGSLFQLLIVVGALMLATPTAAQPQLVRPGEEYSGAITAAEGKWFYVEESGSLPYKVDLVIEDGLGDSTVLCWSLSGTSCEVSLEARDSPKSTYGLLPGEKVYFNLSPGSTDIIQGDLDYTLSITTQAIKEMPLGWDDRAFESVPAGQWDFWYLDVDWEVTEITAVLDVTLFDTWAVDIYLARTRPPTINNFEAAATNLSLMALAQQDDSDRMFVEIVEGRTRYFIGVYGAGCHPLRCGDSEYNLGVNLVQARQIENKRLPYLYASLGMLTAGCTMCAFIGVRSARNKKDLRALYDEHPALYVPTKPWYKRIKWESTGHEVVAAQYVGGSPVGKDDKKSLLGDTANFQADYAGLGNAVTAPPAYTTVADGGSSGSRRNKRNSGSGSRRGASKSRGSHGSKRSGSGGGRGKSSSGGSRRGNSHGRRTSGGSKRGGGGSSGSKRSGGSRRGDPRPYTTATQASAMTRGNGGGSGRRPGTGVTQASAVTRGSGITMAANPYSNVGFTPAEPKLGTGLGAGADEDAARIGAVARLKALRTMPIWVIVLIILMLGTFTAMGFTTASYLNPSLFEVSLCGFYVPRFNLQDLDAEVLMIFRARNVNAVTVYLDNIALDLFTRELFLGSVVAHPGNFAPGETRIIRIPIALDLNWTSLRENYLELLNVVLGEYNFRIAGNVEFSVPTLRLDFSIPLDVTLSIESTGSGSGAYFGCDDPTVLFGGNGLEARRLIAGSESDNSEDSSELTRAVDTGLVGDNPLGLLSIDEIRAINGYDEVLDSEDPPEMWAGSPYHTSLAWMFYNLQESSELEGDVTSTAAQKRSFKQYAEGFKPKSRAVVEDPFHLFANSTDATPSSCGLHGISVPVVPNPLVAWVGSLFEGLF